MAAWLGANKARAHYAKLEGGFSNQNSIFNFHSRVYNILDRLRFPDTSAGLKLTFEEI
jgi:hypothetical protein